MKKIITLVILLTSFLSYIPVISATKEDNNYFVVTAYYSPLPDQKYYITGDYQKELRLNGQGIAGASGKWVFSGMLAAPGKYSFGTKIYLDGLGIGSVEDRGWAIVPAGERGYSHDRIDVWMWYGDEGLRRANFWGKRKVYWYVVDPHNATTINYKNVPAPNWAITWLKLAWSTTTITTPISPVLIEAPIPTIFDTSLSTSSDSESISEMQSIFKELWYMTREFTDGLYDEATIDNIVDFQMSYNLISDPYEIGAGSFGPKTRSKLKELYDTYLIEQAEKEAFLWEIETLKNTGIQEAKKHIDTLGTPLYGEISPRIRDLQKTLAKLWYFEYKDTAIFWVKTKNAIVEYQLENNIISQDSEIWAGVFWPKTREDIIIKLWDVYFLDYLGENELLEKYNSLEKKDSEKTEVSKEIENSISVI